MLVFPSKLLLDVDLISWVMFDNNGDGTHIETTNIHIDVCMHRMFKIDTIWKCSKRFINGHTAYLWVWIVWIKIDENTFSKKGSSSEVISRTKPTNRPGEASSFYCTVHRTRGKLTFKLILAVSENISQFWTHFDNMWFTLWLDISALYSVDSTHT